MGVLGCDFAGMGLMPVHEETGLKAVVWWYSGGLTQEYLTLSGGVAGACEFEHLLYRVFLFGKQGVLCCQSGGIQQVQSMLLSWIVHLKEYMLFSRGVL